MTKIIFLLILTLNSGAQSKNDFSKVIHGKLEELKKLTAEDFPKKVSQHRDEIQKYFEYKKAACRGEFSQEVFGTSTEDSNESKIVRKKLSKEERKLCLREMKAMQMTFINNLFLARKTYLNYQHKKRVEQLMSARENAVKSLQKSFSKRGL